MGLLTIIKKLKRRERQIRILMVGLDNAGKTTVLKSINGEGTSMVGPTLGFNISSIQYDSYMLNVWDVGGQKSLRAYWRNYFEQTDGLIWVVDSADIERLHDCRDELHSLLLEEKLAGASLLILANKQDLGGALRPDAIAKVLGLEELAKGRRHVQLCGCSAVEGTGVLDGLSWLVADVAARLYVLS